MKPERKKLIQEYAETIIIAVLIALFIRTFIVQAFKIPSGSMKETLLIGDHILVNKFIYGIKAPYLRKTIVPIGAPARGDIVVFIYPVDRSKDFIKRVVAVAGDTIEIRDKRIYLNGELLDDDYGIHTDTMVLPGAFQPRDNFGPERVPEGAVFVMGDNRDQSYDSRFWGFVNLDDILGKAFIIYWSWDSSAHFPRWQRIGRLLQ